MSILITGAAGYIGSHTLLACLEAGREVIALDDLSTGRRDLIPEEATFKEGNAGDAALIGELIRRHGVTAVIHFAGSIVVPDSVADPLGYYANNTCVSRSLIEACCKAGVRHFVFSSTAAVYGNPDKVPIDEDAPTRPISPYGSSKLMTEWILRDTAVAHDLSYLAFRYFNVAGADAAGRSGQAMEKATHLIKVACEVVVGRRASIEVFGEDYDTPDGTCIRDYIHVSDLAAAHVAGLDYLEAGGISQSLNCGYGRGASVREVLDSVQRVAGQSIDIRSGLRRPGDPMALIADCARLRQSLNWTARHDDLDTIVGSALAWERSLAEAG